jgi:iron complex outermembrane recepter protein
MKQRYSNKFFWLNVYFLSIFGCFLFSQEAGAESKKSIFNKTYNQLSFERSPSSPPKASTSARDLLAQQNITRVTGVEVNQTEDRLEVILRTPAGSQRLVPLILPEGNNLVIDILDATLAFSIRNGVTETNPAPGINQVRLTKVDESSIRLTITGENQTPSVEVVPSRQNLVLSVTPEKTTVQQQDEPVEEIEIIVTEVGTRTETDPQDVPQTIQTIPQEVIENRQTNNLTETLRSVPGVISESGTRQQFSDVLIRGFFADYRRNGLKEGLSQASGVQTANIDRVEVLKGPASVLYGQGSFGGTVNIITKKPTDKPFYQVEGAIGNYDLYRGAIDLSGPLNESKTVKYRLNLAAEAEGSFIDFYDRDRFQIAPVLSWEISENTDITFEFEYSSYSGNTDIGLPVRGTILDNPNGEIPLDRFVSDPDRDFEDAEFILASYDLEHRFSDNWRIRNAFQFTTRQYSAFATFPINLQEDNRTLELIYSDSPKFDIYDYLLDTYVVGNFNTGGIEHELVAGIELFRSELFGSFDEGERSPIDIFTPNYDNIIYPPPTDIFQDETVNQNLGIYLQDKVEFTDSLILLVGGRFDIVNTKFNDLIAETVDFDQKEEFSPRVGIVYKPIPEVSLYTSYSRSFVPNFFGRSEEGELFDPQRGTQYEIGAKAELNDKISITLAYFDLTITNVLTEDDDNPAFSVQTGEQNSKGVELFASGEILPGWDVIGGYVYNDATVTEDNLIPVGNRLNNVPEHAISLLTNYEIQQGDWKGLGFSLGIYFVGDRQGDLDNTFEVPGYTRTDASIFYNRGKFRTALNFRNIFDIDYFESAQTDLRVRPGDPFTVVGSVSFEF